MTSEIRVLSEETINQIAAGEVIENPASVVKELIENSLDANSHDIIVELSGGGFHRLQVTDDGCGMSKDDVVLSLERHATSKVRTIDDVVHVRSMGFRGEALASIASISKMTMTTNKVASHPGVQLVAEGGRIKTLQAHPRVRGTTIEVSSLFYTVPARKKFQKSPAQSLSDIHKAVATLALGRPDVRFRLFSQDTEVLDAHRSTLKERIEEVLGKEYAKKLLAVTYEKEGIKVEGFIGEPSQVRSNRTGQYLFINGRAVYSSAVSFAVADGYATMLEARKHPLFVLHVTLSPEALDVNVHPQKKEVRFKEESFVKESLREAVRLALEVKHGLQAPSLPREGLSFSSFIEPSKKSAQEFYHQNVLQTASPLLSRQEEVIPWTVDLFPKVEDLQIIGIYKHYLMIEAEVFQPPYVTPPYQGFFVVHLQLAMTRLYFDAAMHSQGPSMDMQTLLFPMQVTVTPAEGQLLESELELLQALGVMMRPFGKEVFIIEACSTYFDEEKILELIESFIGEMQHTHAKDRKARLAVQAAQFVQKRTKSYTKEEAKKIVHTLLQSDQPYFCPLGRKILTHVNFSDGTFFDK